MFTIVADGGRVHAMGGIGADHQRVAVRGRALDCLRGDDAVSASLVLNDDGLAEIIPQLLRNEARHAVGRAPGRTWEDHADRTPREGLRSRARRQACEKRQHRGMAA